jgi:PAS domain S-box-containing protein
MVSFINKYSIKKKFQIILLLASISTLVLASTGLIISMFFTQRSTLMNKYSMVGSLISDNCSAALMFNDTKTAAEILASLKSDENIVSAFLYDKNHIIFAKYEIAGNKNINLYQTNNNIVVDNENIGQLQINAKRSSLYSGMIEYSIIALIVLGASILFSMFISTRIHRSLSGPIIKLGEIAKEVSVKKDYSIRAPIETFDEIGELAKLFNKMLEQTEIQNKNMENINLKLEEIVVQRTKELKDSEEKYKSIVENSSDLIMLTEPDGTITYLSPACYHVLEYDINDLLNTKKDTVYEEDAEKYQTNFVYAIRKGQNGSNVEYRILTKEGKIKWVSHSWSVIFQNDEVPSVKLIVSLLRDITSLKNTEKQKEEMQKQIFLSSKLASIGELAAGIAHEINNPLAVIQGTIDIIDNEMEEKKIENELIHSVIDKQGRSVQRIATIVNGLRVYARMDTSVEELVDIHKVIEDSLSLVEFIYKKESIEIEKKLNAKASCIVGNTGKIQQVIMNLLSNAKDALKDKEIKKITLSTENSSQYLVMKIHDNGCGIPKENIDKIFDTFFTTKPVGQGTGLGLGIVHSIINSVRGTINVESKINIGTTFIITVPTLKGDLMA